jgi:NADH-quinone oxidoreductase subunit J/NAD(P)H-quinone oxidoreductase subunit 6
MGFWPLLAVFIVGGALGTTPFLLVVLGILADWEDGLFVLLSGVLLGSGFLVVTMRDIIRCGLAMIVCFLALAGLYVLAQAPLVAAAQVLVYIGAISVLVLFAIMLTQTKAAPSRLVFQTQAVPAAIAAVVLAFVVSLAVGATDWSGAAVEGRQATDTGQMAKVLFESYVLPFEVVSVLLLAAVIGGVFLAKREGGTTR